MELRLALYRSKLCYYKRALTAHARAVRAVTLIGWTTGIGIHTSFSPRASGFGPRPYVRVTPTLQLPSAAAASEAQVGKPIARSRRRQSVSRNRARMKQQRDDDGGGGGGGDGNGNGGEGRGGVERGRCV
jgi:hypothetical protein